jgi:hypothetical protein
MQEIENPCSYGCKVGESYKKQNIEKKQIYYINKKTIIFISIKSLEVITYEESHLFMFERSQRLVYY